MTINQLIAYLSVYPGTAEVLVQFQDGTGGSVTGPDIKPLADAKTNEVRWVMIARDETLYSV